MFVPLACRCQISSESVESFLTKLFIFYPTYPSNSLELQLAFDVGKTYENCFERVGVAAGRRQVLSVHEREEPYAVS